MDEVWARRALQRAAYAEDWLGRVKDDLAAGHRREAFTHLLTAQAELRLLSEALQAECVVPEMVQVSAPISVGLPARRPLGWAFLGAAVTAMLMFALRVPTSQGPIHTPEIAITDSGAPATVVAEPITIATLPDPIAEEPVATELPATPLHNAAPQVPAPQGPAPRVSRVRPAVLTPEPVIEEPIAAEPSELPPHNAAAQPPLQDYTVASLLAAKNFFEASR